VRCVWREQEHLAFGDDDVAEGAFVDDFEEHGATVLVEPFGGFVDVVVGSGVGTAYYLLGLSENEEPESWGLGVGGSPLLLHLCHRRSSY